jgi:hypothetical protein
MVAADVASLALVVGGIASGDHGSKVGSGLMLAGLGTYLIGGPTVHFVQHRTRTGFASLAVRGGAPLALGLTGAVAGAVIGSKMSCGGGGDHDDCGLVGLAVGFLVGFASGGLAAMVVDDAFLARRPAAPPRRFAVTMTPTYQPVTGQAGVALHATW